MKKLNSHNWIRSLGLLSISCIFLLFICNCKPKDTRPYGPQYEEDPGPERGTTAERLEGNWKIEDFIKDGTSIYNQMNSVGSVSINLENVQFTYIMAKKDNDWNETKIINPWPCYFALTESTFKFRSATYDSTFTYWFLNPMVKSNNSPNTIWTITKLYKNSFYIKLTSSTGTFKILWKRN